MKRVEELEQKLDALIEEFSDVSYEDFADTFEYYASTMKSKASRL